MKQCICGKPVHQHSTDRCVDCYRAHWCNLRLAHDLSRTRPVNKFNNKLKSKIS